MRSHVVPGERDACRLHACMAYMSARSPLLPHCRPVAPSAGSTHRTGGPGIGVVPSRVGRTRGRFLESRGKGRKSWMGGTVYWAMRFRNLTATAPIPGAPRPTPGVKKSLPSLPAAPATRLQTRAQDAILPIPCRLRPLLRLPPRLAPTSPSSPHPQCKCNCSAGWWTSQSTFGGVMRGVMRGVMYAAPSANYLHVLTLSTMDNRQAGIHICMRAGHVHSSIGRCEQETLTSA